MSDVPQELQVEQQAPAAETVAPVEVVPAAQTVPEVKAEEVKTGEATEAKKEEAPNNNGRNGQRTFKKYENKSKFDPSTLPVTDNAAEIRAQVWPSLLT
jgi:hypothetical protein